MDNNNRPHSRQKTVGSGSVNAGRGNKVNTGSRPVGFGGRTQGSSGGRDISNGTQRALPPINLKTILVLGVLVIGALILLKACGGLSLPFLDNSGDIGNNTNNGTNFASAEVNSASYRTVDTNVSPLARKKYYTPADGDSVTVMVYMCGTDLESKYGMATKDLNEMLAATYSDKVNVIVETGGCTKWQNNKVSNATNQIHRINKDGMTLLENNFGTESMTEPTNLTKFIKYCTTNYKADRNILIFWDHGGGSVTGYGYDEKNPNSPSMTLARINSALANVGCKFDFIGFDACLMATLETDLVCNNYADYMIGSEETEPGTGWYYTNWLTMLSENTATPTVYLAQRIIDDFVNSCCAARANAQVTLSVVDLSELDGTVPDALRDFAASTNTLVSNDDYQKVSEARSGARQFSPKSKLNQTDLIDFAERIGTTESSALAKALHSCVKYNKTTISRSNGISIYFPYENTKTVKSAVASFNEIGKDDDYSECMDEYTKCIQSFASLEYGGQIVASASQTSPSVGGFDLGSLISSSTSQSSSTSPLGALSGLFGGGDSAGFSLDASSIASLLGGFSGRSMPAEYDWVDTDLIADHADDIAAQFVDPSRITATEKDGHRVLSLTDEEWNLISTVELNVFLKDGDGYIDLGLDNTFDWLDSSKRDLLLEHDGTWLTVNGNLCAYYMVSDTQRDDGTWVTVGRIPALLNKQLVNLQVIFDERDHPEGIITGAYPMYSDVDVQAKGDIDLAAGDVIQPICDYYDLDGSYSASYTLGSSFTVPNGELKLTNLALENSEISAMYRLTDIYGNNFWIPAE